MTNKDWRGQDKEPKTLAEGTDALREAFKECKDGNSITDVIMMIIKDAFEIHNELVKKGRNNESDDSGKGVPTAPSSDK